MSENGKLWQEPLYDRNAILKRFIDAKKIYDLNNDIYMELALTKSSWSVIGYVSHKEYSGDFLLNWYNALVDLDEANIHRFAREIKDVSDKIELLGDNRMRHHIDSKIFSDVFSEGIKDIISFLKNEYYFSQAMKSPYYLVDGLTGYLRKNNPNREQLLLIWTTGMVLLDWRLEDNHSSIAALQKAIEICALRNGYCDIHSDLSLLGPAYINLMRDPVKYIIPDRWVDNTSFSEETTSVEYYEQMIHEYVQDKSYSSKSYFDEIPNRGHKLFIKKNRPSPWINGYDCVMEQIELLSERLEVDGEHLEKRVADYCDKIPDTVQLIKLGRKWRGCRVVCENPNRSFLRVLYKDWYNHKFDWEETELGRIVLSASEPYCLLITPQLWTYNNGYLLNPPESFISSSSVEQKKQIHDILFEGVDDTETVLAGGIIDYTHKEEIFGFMVSYFSIPGLPSKYAAHCYERNSRLLLQSRPDFSEQEHYNITLHHNGIESFQGSNIMCGFSKISLDEFHWHINITVNGMRLFNEGGQEIGRFEYYYGQRGNMGNRYISNQPLLQRWVVSKDAISKARCIVGCPNNIKINHAFDSVIRKYED